MAFFNKLGIQSKLISLVLLVSLLSILLTGLVSYTSSRDSMTQAAYNQVTGLRNARAAAISEYFNTMNQHVLTMSESRMVVQAIKDFKPAFAKLKDEKLTPAQLQKLKLYYSEVFIPELKRHVGGNPQLATYFPTLPADQYTSYYYTATNPYPEAPAKLDDPKDGSEFTKVHKFYNPLFRRVAEAFNYEDLYLVDIETGNILYSLRKGVDLGANLNTGVFNDTGLARAYKAVQKSRDPNFATAIDFENYKPAYGRPSAFEATTVFEGDQFIGALIFRIVPDKIDQIMNADQKWAQVGLGEKGEALLIGQDNLVRSSPRLFLENPDAYYEVLAKQGTSPEKISLIKNAGTPILIQQIKNQGVQDALSGKTGTAQFIGYRGVPVLGAYQPIKFGNFEWALIAKMDQGEVFSGIRNLARRMLIAAAILIPLITLFSIWLAKSFLAPIQKLIAGNREVAAGNPNVEIKVNSQDEFGELTSSFNQMARSLQEKEQAMQSQMRENDRLLLSILPPKAAARLKSGEQDIAESFPSVTVLFADLEGFNSLSAKLEPDQAIVLLNELIGAFDEAAERYGVEKLRSMGSTYLAVCGLSVPRVDHTKRTVDFALEMLHIIRRFSQKQGVDLSLDIGIHSGSVAAGVVGKTKFNYDVWGETINIARGIHESLGQNVIQVTKSVFDALQGLYHFEQVNDVVMKGKDKLPVWEVTPLNEFAAEVGAGES